MRGKREHLYDALHERGITPAGAGKTKPVASDTAVLEDHPRRCGENIALYMQKFSG